jgi:cytochrome c5
MRLALQAGCLTLMLAACGTEHPPAPDSGNPVDAGVDAGDTDAGEADAGVDAGLEDAGLAIPLPGTDLAAFERGRHVFDREFTIDGGLLGMEQGLFYAEFKAFPVPDGGEEGKDYNGTSCVSCHNIGGPGGQGAVDKGSYVGTFRYNTITGTYPFSTITSIQPHTPPSLFGLSVLDQVSDDYILAHCGVDESRGIHGVPTLNQTVQRFGRRGVADHLANFVSAAFELEMGVRNGVDDLTNEPPGPSEIPDQDVLDTITFVAGLAPPPPLPADLPGQQVFNTVGCAVCHDLSRQGTDQCAHDMGAGLVDDFNPLNHVDNAFSWHTARLVGLRYQTTFLHDGRARTLEEAVAAHGGGESQAVKAAFDAASAEDQAALIRFLQTL